MALLAKKGVKPKIGLDDGHGMTTAGKRTPIFPAGSGMKSETGNFMHENEFNRAVVGFLKTELVRCGFDVVLTAPTDVDTPIGTRVATANSAKCDMLVSVHANAATATWGQANGMEVLSAPKYRKVADVILKHLAKGTAQKNRGWKDGSWLGLTGFNGPMVLVEAAFMDNLAEAKLLLQANYRQECAKEIAQGLCELFGMKYVENTSSSSTNNNAGAYPYDTTKGIGTVKILVDNLNMRKEASFTAPIVGQVQKPQVYYVYAEKNGLLQVAKEAWVSAGAAYTKYTPHPVKARRTYTIVKGDTLWGIASRNNTSVAKLEQLNKGLTSDIVPGQKIYLD